jgi:thiamine biosynthesis lipoprotein
LPILREVAMGTLVSIHVAGSRNDAEVNAAMDRALGWFHEIEERCTRFSERSELMLLQEQAGAAVPASAILYEAVQFALKVAGLTGGAFDPTVGHRMEALGFNREHGTGRIVRNAIVSDDHVSYRDVQLDPDRRTITLRRPLTLDLGAVAKGLAVDMAAHELEVFRDFAIDAGGDLYLGGSSEQGAPWSVGIRHPRNENELIASLRVSNQAVCTSGDYERRTPDGNAHHIVDPRTAASASTVASATVVAPAAMLADALATAAFVLGPEEGIQLLHRVGVEGLIVTPELERFETRGLCYVS